MTAMFGSLLLLSAPAHTLLPSAMPRVFAYIDPATTTYLIQIISAVVITLGVTVGIFFSRLRLSLLNLYVRLSKCAVRLFSKSRGTAAGARGSAAVRAAQSGIAAPISRKRFLWEENRTLKSRLLTALPVAAAFSFTFILFGIYEFFMLNTDSFSFPFSLIAVPIVLAFVLVLFLTATLLLLFRGRVFDSFVSLVFGLILAGYVQANFLNGTLGQLSGDQILWSSRTREWLMNSLIWLVILAIPFLVRFFRRKVWTVMVRTVCCLLIVIQLIAMTVITTTRASAFEENRQCLSTGNIYRIAPGKNIIVIVLDRLDNRYIEGVLRENPHFFDRLDGFTRFTDNLSTYSQTFPSVINMLTGQLYMFERPRTDFTRDAWSSSDFLPRLREHQYNINLYMEKGYTYSNASELKPFTDNIAEEGIRVNKSLALKQFLKLSVFRYAPIAVKPFFWTSSDRFGQLISLESDAPPYVTNDLRYYQHLCEQGLSVTGTNNRFMYLHLQGPHAPYVMDENAQPVPSSQSGAITQTKGSFHILFEYFDQLKKLGRYKDSTIVITGDHGSRKDDDFPLDRAIVTGLFVKPSGCDTTPLVLNHAPVNSDNLRPFIYAEAGLPYAPPGRTYFEVPETERCTRYLYHHLNGIVPNRLLTYKITGNANDFDNWELIRDVVIDY